MVESGTTLLMPSVVQKRPMAKGKSAEMVITTVLSRAAAFSLNLRAEVAQTAVSRLGTMFSTLRLPAKSASVTSLRSLPTSLKSGADWPFCGKLPATLSGLPPRVTVVMSSSPGVWRARRGGFGARLREGISADGSEG